MDNIIIAFIATLLVGIPVGFISMYLAEYKEIREHKKEMQAEWVRYMNSPYVQRPGNVKVFDD